MALTKCQECGHDVSTQASVCQNCGTPDFLSEEGKEMLRKERQRDQLKRMVDSGGTKGLLSTKKKKREKQKRITQAPQPAVASTRQPSESSVNKGFGLGCGLVFGILFAIIAILILIPLLGISMCALVAR